MAHKRIETLEGIVQLAESTKNIPHNQVKEVDMSDSMADFIRRKREAEARKSQSSTVANTSKVDTADDETKRRRSELIQKAREQSQARSPRSGGSMAISPRISVSTETSSQQVNESSVMKSEPDQSHQNNLEPQSNLSNVANQSEQKQDEIPVEQESVNSFSTSEVTSDQEDNEEFSVELKKEQNQPALIEQELSEKSSLNQQPRQLSSDTPPNLMQKLTQNPKAFAKPMRNQPRLMKKAELPQSTIVTNQNQTEPKVLESKQPQTLNQQSVQARNPRLSPRNQNPQQLKQNPNQQKMISPRGSKPQEIHQPIKPNPHHPISPRAAPSPNQQNLNLQEALNKIAELENLVRRKDEEIANIKKNMGGEIQRLRSVIDQLRGGS